MKELLIAIPVYNEANRIGDSIKKIVYFLDRKEVDYSIVLAVDKSPDNSEKVCLKLASTYDRVAAMVNDKKGGRGLAVRKAWLEHNAKVYGFIDADLSVGVESLYDAYTIIKEGRAQFVIGSRYSAGSRTSRPPLRRAVSFSYNVILQRLFNNSIKDYQCGLKVISDEILNSVIGLSRVDSWFWDAEIILLSLRLGFNVYQMPVNWIEKKYKRTSVKRLLHDVILHGWGTIQVYKRLNLNPKIGKLKARDSRVNYNETTRKL